jgi:hypothetical protein
MKRVPANDRATSQVLRLAIALLVGAVAGLTALALFHRQMAQPATRGAGQVGDFLAGGVACLVAGIFACLAFRPTQPLAKVRPPLIALLLGAGSSLLTLAIFLWLQRVIFVYRQYPELNYLLGEIGGYSAPGLGLCTCATVLIWNYVLRPSGSPRPHSGADLGGSFVGVSQPQGPLLGVLSRLALASMLGAGTGLLGGAMTYVVLGSRGPPSVLAGYLAVGLGSLAASVACLLLCAGSRLPWLWGTIALLFVVAGAILCGVGLTKWLAY